MSIWQGPREDENSVLIVGEKVGRGGASLVYQGTSNGKVCAIKKFRVTETENLDQNAFSQLYSEFRRELWNLNELHHKNILSLWSFSKSQLHITAEFVPHGNLYYYLHNQSMTIDWPMRLRIALDIAEAMQFLHNQKPSIIHMDLKSPNGKF